MTDKNPDRYYSCVVKNDLPQGLRLDRYIAEYLVLFSRSQIKTRKLKALLNNKQVKISRILKGGETLELFWENPEPVDLIPQDIPLDIVYEDKRVAVINKEQGMVVHPGAGNHTDTLANALYYKLLQKHNGSGTNPGNFNSDSLNPASCRPGIIHRLDKDTSGLIITAWDAEAHKFCADQFKKRKVIKTYAAIVHGCPAAEKGIIEQPIARSRHNRKLFTVNPDGKPSITRYKVVQTFNNYSLLLLRPKTGRTHQIRVHLKHIGHPVLGDPLYGKPLSLTAASRFPGLSLMLHAKRLSIVLPGKEVLGKQTFRTILPKRFRNLIKQLKNEIKSY